ncbi:unnamed protein product [Boreogadus saida]
MDKLNEKAKKKRSLGPRHAPVWISLGSILTVRNDPVATADVRSSSDPLKKRRRRRRRRIKRRPYSLNQCTVGVVSRHAKMPHSLGHVLAVLAGS